MATGNNEIQQLKHDLKLIFYLNDHYFSYSIFNTVNNCFEKIKKHKIRHGKHEFHNQISDIINLDDDLKLKYKTTLGAIDNGTSTFIPNVLFDKKNIKQYIEHTYGQTNDTYQCVQQQFANCYAIFTINNNLLLSLNQHFDNLTIKSSGSLLVDYVINLSQKTASQLFAQINRNNFHIILIANGEFEFYNQFHFDNDDDFIYYFMNCLNILGIESSKLTMDIMSDLDKKEPLFEKLREYMIINFINRPDRFLYNDEIIQTASHKHHNLFSQLICE